MQDTETKKQRNKGGKTFDATAFVAGLQGLQSQPPKAKPVYSTVVELLKTPSVYAEVHSALQKGYSRTAIATVLRTQRKVSVPVIRKALDAVIPVDPKGANEGVRPAGKPVVTPASPPTVTPTATPTDNEQPTPPVVGGHQAMRRARI